MLNSCWWRLPVDVDIILSIFISIFIRHIICFMLFQLCFTSLSLINSLDRDVKRLGETEEVG